LPFLVHFRLPVTNGLLQKKKRNPKGLTVADGEAQKSENLIQQDFTAETPNTKWLSDISEVPETTLASFMQTVRCISRLCWTVSTAQSSGWRWLTT
jgi:transposase InsO family protein